MRYFYELSRYLSASIAGSSHRSDVFMRMQRSSGADEYIRFGDGDDLGLNSIRIICSEETASSSELVISGLRGIDFPVKLFGSRTEGKNVGMEVQEYKYGNSYYEFAPITFRSFNAKDWGDYADGIEPDVMLNNQNADYTDDIDNAFRMLLEIGITSISIYRYGMLCVIFKEWNPIQAKLKFAVER